MSSAKTVASEARNPSLGRIDQVCLLVDDIDRGVVEYSNVYSVPKWRGYLYTPDTVPELGYRGDVGRFSIWIALSESDPQIELIQSLNGPSVYTEWLERHGFGFHHFGTFTENLAADVQALEAQGLIVSQWGRGYGLDGDGGFVYFDSVARLGVFIELIEIPRRRRRPDREWVITR